MQIAGFDGYATSAQLAQLPKAEGDSRQAGASNECPQKKQVNRPRSGQPEGGVRGQGGRGSRARGQAFAERQRCYDRQG
jgi:hypothetical protein